MVRDALTANVRLGLTEELIELPSRGARSVVPRLLLPREGFLWLLATLLIFLTGLFKGINLLVLLAYLLGGIWLLNRRMLRLSLRRVHGKRVQPGPIFAGDPVDCGIELRCSGKRPVRGLVVVDRGAAHERWWLMLSLKPGLPLRIRHQETFPDRGRYRAAALRAYSSFPFGLTIRGIDLTAPEEWIVLPRLGRVAVDQMRHWLTRILRGDGRMRRRRLVPAAMEADIHGLRDFRPGDSPRWIHWRTSARRNQLLVREFEDSARPHLVIVVDPWLPAAPTANDRLQLETLISLAGTIVRDWCRDLSTRLTLIIAAQQPTALENGTGSEFALHILEVLAVEQGRNEAENLAWLQGVNRAVRSAPILVLSTRSNSTMSGAISNELGRPVARLDPRELPAWYERPQVAEALPT